MPASTASRFSEKETWGLTDFDILWRHWGNEHVIYCAGSGDTLLVNNFGEQILKLLLQGPRDVKSIVADTSEALGMVQDTEFTFAVKGALTHFLKFGLITRIQ